MSQRGPEGAPAGSMERRLGVPAVFAVCTGAMFSSGFFLLPGLAADETGPSVPLAYLAAGVLVLPALLSLAELSSAMPRAGGPYYFLARGLGPLAGIIGSLGKYLQLIFKGAFAFVGLGSYLTLVADVPVRPVAITLVVVFTLINLLGTGSTARAELALVAVLVLLLAYLTVSGTSELLTAGEVPAGRLTPLFAFGAGGFVSAVALVFVSFAGVGQVASVSEEVRDPARTIPKGMLLALATATFFYVAGTAIMVGLLSPTALRDDPTPVATVAAQFTVLPLPIPVVVIAALAAFTSTGNAAILSAARYPLAMARDELLWSRFARLSDRGVPRLAVLLTGAVMAASILLFDVEGIAKLASAFLLLIFVGMCLLVVVFRESGLTEYQPGFRVPGYPWTPGIGIVAYVALIAESGGQALGMLGLLLVGSGVWYGLDVRHRTSPSGAVYRLFARLAEREQRDPQAHDPWLSEAADRSLDQLTARAVVVDVEDPDDLHSVIARAAEALVHRVGGDADTLAEELLTVIRSESSPVTHAVAIAPTLLPGIEQPEMVLVRLSEPVTLDGEAVHGLVVVVDDEHAASRLLHTVGRIISSVELPGFDEAWNAAEQPDALREALTRGVVTLRVRIDGRADADSPVGTRIRDLDLPDGSLVTMIHRGGRTVIPSGDEQLQEGDQLTLLAEADLADTLLDRFR